MRDVAVDRAAWCRRGLLVSVLMKLKIARPGGFVCWRLEPLRLGPARRPTQLRNCTMGGALQLLEGSGAFNSSSALSGQPTIGQKHSEHSKEQSAVSIEKILRSTNLANPPIRTIMLIAFITASLTVVCGWKEEEEVAKTLSSSTRERDDDWLENIG